MDLDAYVLAHQGEWARLQELAKQRRLTSTDADELLDLYQRVATHLSYLRSAAPDPTVLQYLSTILAKARSRAMGARTSSWESVGEFFLRTFPAKLYTTRRWWLTVLLVNVVVAFAIGWWVADHPGVQTTLLSPSEIDKLVNHDFADYYSEHAAGDFAGKVWTNNAWVAAVCIAGGALGFPVILMLWSNIFNLGAIGGLMASHGRASVFFGLILPHGMLELTAVFVAAGTGLQLFWSWVEPGDLTRSASFARAARSAMTVAMGLVVVLLISGVIEAFVTPSDLPTWARIAIGALAEAAFLTYVFTLGRVAAREGVTGDVADFDQAAFAPARG
ncbi:stage II sporulation protein M [Calidifontibacter terrae]